jgi:hypothetical protein
MNSVKKKVLLFLAIDFLLATIGVVAFLVITHAKTTAPPQQSDDLGKFDPKLLLYEQAGEGIATGFKEPRGICVDQAGKLLVVGDQVIRVFGADRKFLRQIDLPAQPRCISQAADGKIYVGMTNYVLVMDAALNKVATWDKLDGKSVIASIAPGADDVFVADAGRRVVLRYDTSGKIIDMIGQRAAGEAPIFVIPSPYFDVAIAPDGLLRIAETGRFQVETYTFDGKLMSAWGRPGTGIEDFTGCCNPVNFAILPDGGFVTAEKGLTRVKIYDSAGKFVGVVAGPDSFVRHDTICAASGGNCQTGGLDVAVDKLGRVFVMDPYTADVRIFVRKAAATSPAATKPATTQAEKDKP